MLFLFEYQELGNQIVGNNDKNKVKELNNQIVDSQHIAANNDDKFVNDTRDNSTSHKGGEFSWDCFEIFASWSEDKKFIYYKGEQNAWYPFGNIGYSWWKTQDSGKDKIKCQRYNCSNYAKE